MNKKTFFILLAVTIALLSAVFADKITAQAPKPETPTASPAAASEYGSISGNVKFKITENSSINFEAKEATLTAPADKPFTSKELKNHFYGEQSSYFYHHFPLYKTKIDKDGNFVFSNVKPGEYDILVFAKRESTWGYQRVAWKLYVNVEAARVTKVRLDNYNNAVDDFVYLQM